MPKTNKKDSSGIYHLREDGVLESVQDAIRAQGTGSEGLRWDDIRTSATTVNPPGLASDPDRDTSDGTLLFDASGTELIFIEIQMPHDWKEEDDIHPHIHWCKTTSATGDVVWQLEYKHFPINAVGDSSFTSLGEKYTAEFTEQDTEDWHQITSLGYMDMTGKGDSHVILFKLSRIGSSSNDTYGADAKMLSFDIHYRRDSRGSVIEYPGAPA